MLDRIDGLEAHIDGWEIQAPEGVYDFSEFEPLAEFARSAIRALLDFRSTNGNEPSRRRSNVTEYKRLKNFLRFAARRAESGHAVGYDLATFTAYEKAMLVYRPMTEVTYISFARRVFRFVMEAGEAPSFDLPAPKDQKAALATVKDKTLAECITELPEGFKDRADLNMHILAQIADWCWERIFEVRDRQELAQKWLSARLQPKENVFQKDYISREEALREIVVFLWGLKDGYMPQTRYERKFTSRKERNEERIRRALYVYIDTKCRHYSPPITIHEIEDYMKPSHRQVCAFLPLFAAVGISPISIIELETEMLVDGPEEGTKTIRWKKYRANRELKTEAWRVLGRNSRTIPNAWNILERITDGVRRDASPEFRKYLFLCVPHRSKEKDAKAVSPLTNYVTMRILNTQLKSCDAESHRLLRMLDSAINLKMIRTTEGVLRRFDGEFKASQRFFDHRQPETTVGYLDSPTYRAFLDDKMLGGIDHLYSFITEKPKLLPDDVGAIVAGEGLSQDIAVALVEDELNVGYGISLSQDKAYVIDTPLNYLRMERMLGKITSSAARLELENPERWRHYWMPQIPLYAAALEDFPRRTREASKTLEAHVVIPELY